MKEKKISFNHRSLFYRIVGEGPSVVLLHGFGEDGNIWKNQANNFPEYQLIIPDLPGSGLSEMIDDMSMEGLAEAVHYILQKEEIFTCVIVGHSMGGYITLAYVDKFPETITGFGLFHSSAFADSEEKKATREKAISFIEGHGAKEFLKTSIPNLYSPITKENNPKLIEDHIQSASALTNAALTSYYRSMIARPDRTYLLKQTKMPVLFVLGKYDAAVPFEDGLQQSFMPALSYIYKLEISGHMGMLEEAEKANNCLSEFLRKGHRY